LKQAATVLLVCFDIAVFFIGKLLFEIIARPANVGDVRIRQLQEHIVVIRVCTGDGGLIGFGNGFRGASEPAQAVNVATVVGFNYSFFKEQKVIFQFLFKSILARRNFHARQVFDVQPYASKTILLSQR
jgi:hypothetical protein